MPLVKHRLGYLHLYGSEKRYAVWHPTMCSTASHRQQVIQHLCRIERSGIYAGTGATDQVEAGSARAFTDLTNGVTRWKRYLDFLIEHYYSGKFRKLESTLLQILRVGLFELLISQRAPYAVTNETVSLARKMVRPGAGALVNAILRQAARQSPPSPNTGDLAQDLGIRWSHPTWMVRRWLDRYGPAQTRTLLTHNNARPAFGLRCNPLRITHAAAGGLLTELGVPWQQSCYLEDFVRVERLQPVFRTGHVAQGRFVVQDESAGLAVHALNPQPGDTVLDLCAAPGGKALYAAARMQNTGRVLAVDKHANRLGRLEKAAEQQGISSVEPIVADSRMLDRDMQVDRVLVDAPCSGLGVLAKRSDMRWNREPNDIPILVKLQDALLDAAARFVKNRGVLVYSTCTIEKEENEDRVTAFLERHPDFIVEPVATPASVVTAEGYLATLPHVHGIDGSFVARLRKRPTT